MQDKQTGMKNILIQACILLVVPFLGAFFVIWVCHTGNELQGKKQQEYFITKNHNGHYFEILIDSKGNPAAFNYRLNCQYTACKFSRYDK